MAISGGLENFRDALTPPDPFPPPYCCCFCRSNVGFGVFGRTAEFKTKRKYAWN